MRNKFKLNLPRGLALIAVAMSLASFSGFALTKGALTNQTRAATTIAPATGVTRPSAANGIPAKTPGVVAEDIRDIRGPKHLPSPWLWPLWLAGVATLSALFYAGWLWNRRRVLTPALLPYEIALARLEEARALMQPENAREFSIAVSEIVRHYIQARFQVWAARRTTEEFLHDLLEPSDALLTTHRALLADFLHHCDLAKFARWILSIEEMDTMLQSAHNFALRTGKPLALDTDSAAARPATGSTSAAAQAVHANP